VISTQCGGPADIVTEEIGLLVPTEDSEALCAAMEQMLKTASQYDAARIRTLTVERFGKEAVSRRLLAACEDAVKGGAVT